MTECGPLILWVISYIESLYRIDKVIFISRMTQWHECPVSISFDKYIEDISAVIVWFKFTTQIRLSFITEPISIISINSLFLKKNFFRRPIVRLSAPNCPSAPICPSAPNCPRRLIVRAQVSGAQMS